MKTVLLEMKNIHFSYETKKDALKNVSTTFFQGERVAILGSNGAGKSTFFLQCNGVLHPDCGEVFYRGERIGKKRKDSLLLQEKVGIVFQEPDRQIIAPTVETEVSFGPMNLRLPREEVVRRVDSALQVMELEGMRHRPPHYLSGGEKKRVSIADILAMKSEIILLDEPTASLDPYNVGMLENHLERLHQEGATLVISTHDVDFAWGWAERILVFHQGEILGDDTPENIFANERLLEKARLKKPLLYAVAQLLQHTGHLPEEAPFPKKAEDFTAYFGS